MNSINKYSEKQIVRESTKGKKYKKPEKITEKECMAWMRGQGWFVNIFEAKSSLDEYGNYVSSRMKPGTPDCMGITPDGIPIAIEFKAKGKRCSFNKEKNYRQREFISKYIECYGFSVVVDSAERLQEYWSEWSLINSKGQRDEAREYLKNILPKKK